MLFILSLPLFVSHTWKSSFQIAYGSWFVFLLSFFSLPLPFPSPSLAPLSTSLFPRRCVRWVAMVVEVEVERTSPEISECDLFSCQEFCGKSSRGSEFAQFLVPFCHRALQSSTLAPWPATSRHRKNIVSFIFNEFSADKGVKSIKMHVPPSFDKNMNVTELQIKMKAAALAHYLHRWSLLI